MHTLVSLLLEGRTQARVEHPPVKGAADRAAERSAKPVGAEGLPAPDRAWQESNTPRAACVAADRAAKGGNGMGAEGRPAPCVEWADLISRPPAVPVSITRGFAVARPEVERSLSDIAQRQRLGNRPPARMPTEPPARLSAVAEIGGAKRGQVPPKAPPPPIYLQPAPYVSDVAPGAIEMLPPSLDDCGPPWHALERAAWWSMVAVLGLLAGWALIRHPDLQGLRDLIMWLVSE